MTATLLPELSISLQHRRWACVLDPMLALSEYGLLLVKQLGDIIELWVVREFWNMIDSSQFYQQQPEILLQDFATERSPLYSQQILRSLQEWDRLRTLSDRNSWHVHFLADVIGESCLPGGVDSDLIWRWESLAQSLDTQLNPKEDNSLILAVRDLAALAAARPACILTYRLPEEIDSNLPPKICNTLESWGIHCQEVNNEDAIAPLEREQFRTLIIHAGLSKLLWAGLNLVIIHLVVPAEATLTATNWSEEYAFSSTPDPAEAQATQINLWEGSQGFWYTL
jgi:hypothetical protein